MTDKYQHKHCDVKNCQIITRICLRNRRDNEKFKTEDPIFSFYVSIFDQIHHYIFHLFDLGLRRGKNETRQINVDNNYLEFDIENNKFNIGTTYKGQILQLDEMYKYIAKKGDFEQKQAQQLWNYLNHEEYDTDAVENDLDDSKSSNIFLLTIEHSTLILILEFIRNYQRNLRIFAASFSTGFVFFYWEFFKELSQDNIEQMKSTQWYSSVDNMNLFAVDELYVEKFYKSLKKEILCSPYGLVITQWNSNVMLKANQYYETNDAKQLLCKEGGSGEDPLHYNILFCEPISEEHLQAVILYCNFSELATHFKATFRKNNLFEQLNSVKKRNSKYWCFSKLIREVCEYFGDNGETETGPFYCGMNYVMHLSTFAIRLNGPCSTSKQIEIAEQFAGDGGILMQLQNDGFDNKFQRFFDCSWISFRPEEHERLFSGGLYRLRIQSILIKERVYDNTGKYIDTVIKNFKKEFHALFMFDCMVSGIDLKNKSNFLVTVKDKKLLTALINHELGVSSQGLHPYITSTMESFTNKKTQIVINIRYLDQYFQKLNHLIMENVVEYNFGDAVDESKDNMLKPDIFTLFPKMTELTIYASGFDEWGILIYPFSLNSFLSLLQKCPETVKITIKAARTNYGNCPSWLTDWDLKFSREGDYDYVITNGSKSMTNVQSIPSLSTGFVDELSCMKWKHENGTHNVNEHKCNLEQQQKEIVPTETENKYNEKFDMYEISNLTEKPSSITELKKIMSNVGVIDEDLEKLQDEIDDAAHDLESIKEDISDREQSMLLDFCRDELDGGEQIFDVIKAIVCCFVCKTTNI
eukprot:63942_1